MILLIFFQLLLLFDESLYFQNEEKEKENDLWLECHCIRFSI